MTEARHSLCTLPKAAIEAGMEPRTLYTWVDRGLVTPTYPSGGIGRPAQFTPDDVELCKMLARLRRAGCGMEILRRAAKAHIPGGRLTRLGLAEGLVLVLP